MTDLLNRDPDLSDPAHWPLYALWAWVMIGAGYQALFDDRWKTTPTYYKRRFAGVCFGRLAFKMAKGFNFSRFDRWVAMLFGYIGVVNLIDSCSRERTGEQRSVDRLRQTKSDQVAE